MIFEKKNRTDTGPAKNSDSYFGYLDRSARQEAELIRNIMNDWISIYPVDNHPSFINKLRSEDDSLFLSSFFELYLYVLMKKLGSNDIAVEPEVKGQMTRPDFYVQFPSSEKFYLEARCLSEDEDYTNKNAIIDSIIERINNKLKGISIALSLKWDGDPLRIDFSKKILNELIAWIESSSSDKNKNKKFEFDDWSIEFTIDGEVRSDHRVIHGVMPQSARLVTMDTRLRSALRDKGNKYGKLSEKFIIAVNIVDGTYEHQIHNALFGNEGVEFNSNSREHKAIRLGNGFWRGEKIWRYRRVSAVIIANKITPWDIFRLDVNQIQVYHHLNPEFSLTNSVLDKLSSYKKDDDGNYKLHKGELPCIILGLPSCQELE